jgi:hypothetical protein
MAILLRISLYCSSYLVLYIQRYTLTNILSSCGSLGRQDALFDESRLTRQHSPYTLLSVEAELQLNHLSKHAS